MKKFLSILFPFIVLAYSCKKDRTVSPSHTASQTTIFANYHETSNPNDFIPVGNCFISINWWDLNVHSNVVQNANYCYMDSLNYVVRQPVPILMTSSNTFVFQDYYCGTNNLHITGGNATLTGDTLVISVNAQYTSGCTDPFVFHGKYYK